MRHRQSLVHGVARSSLRGIRGYASARDISGDFGGGRRPTRAGSGSAGPRRACRRLAPRLRSNRRTNWKKRPSFRRSRQIKSKYALLQLGLLLDAQGHLQDAERLRDSQQQLMENTRKVIEPALHALPAVAKLEDLGRRIAAVDDDYKETRNRVVAVAAAARNVQNVGDRLADLKRRQSDLETQLVRLRAKVASQTNAAVKAHNEALLAKADQLLADGRAQIAELEASSAAASARLSAVTSETDLAAARATAERIRTRLEPRFPPARRSRRSSLGLVRSLQRRSRCPATATSASTLPMAATSHWIWTNPIELLPGESIRTGRDSEVKLRLFDGSFIQLRENSNFTLRGVDRDDFLEEGAMHRLDRLLNHLMKDPPRRTHQRRLSRARHGLRADCRRRRKPRAPCSMAKSNSLRPTRPSSRWSSKPYSAPRCTHDGWTVETITPEDYERLWRRSIQT